MTYCPNCLLIMNGSFCNLCGTQLRIPIDAQTLGIAIAAMVKRTENELTRADGHKHEKEVPCPACAWIKAFAYDAIKAALERIGIEKLRRA